MFGRGQGAGFDGHLDERDQRGCPSLADQLLVLLIAGPGAPGAAVERVQSISVTAAEPYDGAADRFGDDDPLALRVRRHDCLVAERDRSDGEGLDHGGLSGTVCAEDEDVGGERAAVAGVGVRVPGGEVPEGVGVQIHPHDWAVVPDAGVGDEGVDAGQVLACRPMRRHPQSGEVPVAAVEQTRPERTWHDGLWEGTVSAG